MPPAVSKRRSTASARSSSDNATRANSYTLAEGEDGDVGVCGASVLSSKELSQQVALRLDLPARSALYVIDEHRQGATVPFLARYRKDASGGIDEEVIRKVIATANEVHEVHRRRCFMLKSLEQRGLLTPQLKAMFEKMAHVSQLEDAWEPYKVRTTSLATRAREAGLAPLSEALLQDSNALQDLHASLHAIKDGDRLLTALLCEEITRCPGLREEMLRRVRQAGRLQVTLVKTARKKAAKEMQAAAFDKMLKKFSFYDNKRWPVSGVSSHVVLALQRGEARGVLRVDLALPGPTLPMAHAIARRHFQGLRVLHTGDRVAAGCVDGGAERNRSPSGHGRLAARYLREALQAAHDHLLKSSIIAVRRDLKKSAERDAIQVFAHNLRHMLLQRPMSHARILAMDPGIANGVKCVALDANGEVLSFFKCTLLDENRMIESIRQAIEQKHLNRVVIGNGTASQQTAQVVAQTIERYKGRPGWEDVEFAIVSEAGASVYSTSDIAREEFPSLDIMYRGAVSIGRRVLDPLSELVKIPVRSMGIGMYQHDVNDKELTRALNDVVESCVALVGVNAGSANRCLIEQVPGISKKVVDQIVLARHTKRLHSREDLRRVPGMSEYTFQQVAGFFRFPNSPEVLDNTNIHPESYPLMRQLFALYQTGMFGPSGITVSSAAEVSDATHRRRVGEALQHLSEEELAGVAKALACGTETLKLVGRELRSPALDPRASLRHAGLLRKELKSASSLRPGDLLDGVVYSVTTFGVFVDCGLHDQILVRGEGTDTLRVGEYLSGIVFLALDQLGRPQVRYPSTGTSPSDTGAKRLRLESEDFLPVVGGDANHHRSDAGGNSLAAEEGLRAHLARARQRDERAQGDVRAAVTAHVHSTGALPSSSQPARSPTSSEHPQQPPSSAHDDEDEEAMPLYKRFRFERTGHTGAGGLGGNNSSTLSDSSVSADVAETQHAASVSAVSSEVASSSASVGDGAGVIPKKRRGRPKGSLGKAKTPVAHEKVTAKGHASTKGPKTVATTGMAAAKTRGEEESFVF